MGMLSWSVSSWPLNLLTAVLTASFCMQVLDCLRHSPSGLGWQWGHSSSPALPWCWAARSAWRLKSLIFLLSWEFVRSALSLSRLSPLVISQPLGVQVVVDFRYETGYIRPVDAPAAPVFVQLPGFALDGYKGSIGAVDRYGVYTVVLACGFREEPLPIGPCRPRPAMGNVPFLDVGRHLGCQTLQPLSPGEFRLRIFQCFQCLGDCMVCGCLAHLPCVLRRGVQRASSPRPSGAGLYGSLRFCFLLG